jgi:iron complex transport system substrate-binding protein
VGTLFFNKQKGDWMTRLIVKTLGVLVLFALVITLFSSCSSDEKSPDRSAIVLTDQLGRIVKLDKVPQRIVSLAPQNTEILFALGLGDKIVGVTSYCNYPPEAKEKTVIGGFSTVDIEKVMSLSPDLVVAALIHEKETISQLEDHGLTVLTLAPKTLDDVIQAIELTGKATGTELKASQLVNSINTRMAKLAGIVSGIAEDAKPRVCYVVWHDPLMTAGGDTMQSQLIDFAGGKNIFEDLTYYPTVGLETLLERQPQVIIAGVGHGSAEANPLNWAKSEPRLKNTEALLQGKVFGIDADITSRGGPRMIDALEEMFRLIHPELVDKLKESAVGLTTTP